MILKKTSEAPVRCEKNSYSSGNSATCTTCDENSGEYTEIMGATYCSLCRGVLDSNGDCGG